MKAFAVILAACTVYGATNVPAGQKELYVYLERQLNAVENVLATGSGPATNITVAAELFASDSARGELLFGKRARAYAIAVLDRIVSLGFSAVTVHIGTKELIGATNAPQYAAYYRILAAEIRARKRGIRVVIDLPYGTNRTMQAVAKSITAASAVIIREMSPDYLSVLQDPEYINARTGLLATPDDYRTLTQTVLTGLDSGRTHVGIIIDAVNPEWFDAVAQLPVEYFDIRLSAVTRETAIEHCDIIARRAAELGKSVMMTGWLYKASPRELAASGITNDAVLVRDAFSLWAPLDERFVSMLLMNAKRIGAGYVSCSASAIFFGGVVYSEITRGLSRSDAMELLEMNARTNILNETVNPLGAAMRRTVKIR
ncbi:MAG: hypothetical protein HZC28_09725 [Spirochaetes bacterium]|nr:hypothetical protein [Spirochaetota bacterium]